MPRSPRVLLIAVALAAAAFVLLVLRSHRSPAAVLETSETDAGIIAWCAEGLEPIAGGGCLAMPPAPRLPVPLVLYLHGVYDRATPTEELERQHRVAAHGTSRGYAVLALRSTEGACHPSLPTYATRYCWPSNEEVADRAGSFVDGWQVVMGAAEQRVGKGPRYVLGFSSGGFFAVLLAVRGLYPADAFVVAHAGPVEPVKAMGSKAPILLLSADDDISQEGMVRLDDELSRENWPHEHSARSGGHALTDSDIDAALGFFGQVRAEPSVVRAPASGHRPRARDQDGATARPDPDAAPARPEQDAPTTRPPEEPASAGAEP
jgi:dienelactone hydrolase